MDLTIQMEPGRKLNIRVAIIMETERGFVFQKQEKDTYYFALGGRVKLGESSLIAAKRETEEETGLQIENFTFVSLVENFWENSENKYQEICFVYKTEKVEKILPDFGLVEITKEELQNVEVRPEIIKKLILENKLDNISHFIV